MQFRMENRGAAFRWEQLLNRIWDYGYAGGTRTVDVHVQTLRAELGECAGALETVRGAGYWFGALLPAAMYGPVADEMAQQIGQEAEMLVCALDNMEDDVTFLQALAAENRITLVSAQGECSLTAPPMPPRWKNTRRASGSDAGHAKRPRRESALFPDAFITGHLLLRRAHSAGADRTRGQRAQFASEHSGAPGLASGRRAALRAAFPADGPLDFPRIVAPSTR